MLAAETMIRQRPAGRVARRGLRQLISELIDGPRKMGIRWSLKNRFRTTPTQDPTRADYAFWDKAARCRAEGLDVSGLLIRPLNSKTAAWVMGRAPKFAIEDKYTDKKFSEYMTRHHAKILDAYEKAVGLGDCYMVINADSTITVLPPNVIEPIVDDNDFSQLIGWRVNESHADPDQPGQIMTIEDEYYKDRRIRTVSKNGVQQSRRVYRNLIGKLPVIKISNNKGADETFGHPEADAMLPALHRYGEVIDSAIDGNIRQGRSVPVIEKLGSIADVEAFWRRFGRKESRTMPDGTEEVTDVLDLDADNVITLGGDAVFRFESPNPFMSDTKEILGLLFYLILQHSEIPEFVWGGAIPSSRASAETQVLPFVKWVEKKQGACLDWLHDLADVILGIMRLTDSRIKEMPVQVTFPNLTQKDGTLTLQTIQFGISAGLMDREFALTHLPVDVENPKEVLRKAESERQEQMQEQESIAERRMQQAASLKAASAGPGAASARSPGENNRPKPGQASNPAINPRSNVPNMPANIRS